MSTSEVSEEKWTDDAADKYRVSLPKIIHLVSLEHNWNLMVKINDARMKYHSVF